MIKGRLLELLSSSRKYVYLQVLWQWVSLVCQVCITTGIVQLLWLLVTQQLTPGVGVPLAVALVAALLVRFGSDRQASKASYLTSVDVKRIIRQKIYSKLLRMGASYREHISTAELVQLSAQGAEELEVYFGKYLSQLLYSVLAPLTLFAFLAPKSLPAAAILLVCVPLIPVVIMAIQRIARKLLGSYWDVYASLGDSFLENLQGLTTLKTFQADAMKAQEMDAESERFRVITMKVLSMQLNSTIVMDVIAYGGAALGMVVTLGEFAAGNVAFPDALVIVLLSSEFFIPMRLLGSFFHIAMNGMAASDKMFAFLDLPEPKQGKVRLAAGQPVSVEFEDVRFAYTPEKPILRGVTLSFPAGSIVSLVGMSGCGKSTIARILLGRNKGYEGSVTVNGHQLSGIAEESLMRAITMVSNNSRLFKGSVRENLELGNFSATDDQMAEALRRVQLWDFLEGQQGLETPLLEEASNLSGGQRQRLALARALLHDTPCYVFDEATSNIDVESEEVVMGVIRQLAETKTVVLISHRLANVVGSSCIYLLEDGLVAECGTHAQLMANEGPYARLFTQQQYLESYGRGAGDE